MNGISTVLVRHTRLRIFEDKCHSDIDVKGWLANQNYFVDTPIQQKEFELRPGNPSLLINAFSNECNRMSIATIESMLGIYSDVGLKKSGAWGIIRCYYAAFFAAHAILRMFGQSCTQLESSHTQKIFENAALFQMTGNMTKIEKGFYFVSTNTDFTEVKLTKLNDSHADLWASFLKLINTLIELTHETNTLSKLKLETLTVLEQIKAGVTYAKHSEKGNWLSSIRNDVNYKHNYGAWYPHEIDVDIERKLSQVTKEWNKYPLELLSGNSISDIDYFFNITISIVSFFRELLTASTTKTNPLNNKFKNGSMRILNTSKKIKATTDL